MRANLSINSPKIVFVAITLDLDRSEIALLPKGGSSSINLKIMLMFLGKYFGVTLDVLTCML